MRRQFLILAIALAALAGLFFTENQAGLGSHPNGPAAYYPFDDDTADDAAHSNDGTLNNGASFSTDVPPTQSNVKSLSLDGVDDYVEVPDSADISPTGAMSVSAWIKADTIPSSGDAMIVSKWEHTAGKRSYILFSRDKLLSFATSDDNTNFEVTQGTTDLSTLTGQWVHVTGVFDGSDTEVYLDATQEGTPGAETGIADNNLPLRIGAYVPPGDTRPFDGKIDEVQIYHRALTQAEIDILAGVTDPLYVDDDGQIGFGSLDCDGVGVGAYSTIQDAVDAASPGDTITVCPGTYDEQVAITTDNLTIDGAGAGATIVEPSAVVANTTSLSSGASAAAIILVDGATGVTVQDLTVDGSSAAFGSCSPGYVGVYYRNASGALDASEVTNIFHPSASGCQFVLGVFVQSGGAGSATVSVTDSEVDNYGKNGVTCNEPGTTCTITGNTVTGRGPTALGDAAQNGIQIGFGSTGNTVSGNTVSDHSYLPQTFAATNILVFDADVDITGNILNEGHVSVYYIEGSGDISGNTVTNTAAGVGFSAFWGIVVADPPSLPPAPFGEGSLSVASIIDGSSLSLGPASHLTTMVVNVTGNTIDGDDSTDSIGIESDVGFVGTADIDIDITQNTVTDFDYGVVFFECTTCGGGTFIDAHVNFNNITSNVTSGIENLADVSPPPLSPLDAECNWYGDVSGPSGAGPGTGDAVSSDVDFNPWLDGPFQTASDCGDTDFKVTAVTIECDDPVDINTTLECDVSVSVHNNGPLDPANAKVTVGINVPVDCQDPADHTEDLSLDVSDTVVVDHTFETECSLRSDHTFTGTGEIEEGVSAEDTDPNNNSDSADDTIAVFDLGDVKVTDVSISCPTDADADVAFTCTVDVTVHNNGPTSPVDVGGAINVGVPDNCSVANYDLFGQGYGTLSLVASVSQNTSKDFDITCTDTGFQRIVGCAIVQVNQLHTRDQVPVANNYGTDEAIVDVSDPAPTHIPGRCTTVDPPEECGNGIDDDGDGLIDEEPDTDGDGVNNCDDADDDGDGFADAVEEYIGTEPLADCPWLPGVHPAWPPDFDDSQDVNIIDVLAVKPAFGTTPSDTAYDARSDLNADGSINIVDVLALKPDFGTSCN